MTSVSGASSPTAGFDALDPIVKDQDLGIADRRSAEAVDQSAVFQQLLHCLIDSALEIDM